jgi:hypothetical protein
LGFLLLICLAKKKFFFFVFVFFCFFFLHTCSFPYFSSLLGLLGPGAQVFSDQLSPAFVDLVGSVSAPLAAPALMLLLPLLGGNRDSADGEAHAPSMRILAADMANKALVPAMVWRAGKDKARAREMAVTGIAEMAAGHALEDDGMRFVVLELCGVFLVFFFF